MKDRLGVPPYVSQKDEGWIEGGKGKMEEGREEGANVLLIGPWEVLLDSSTGRYY